MPRDAADILEKNKISGNIFNAYDFGGYLEFRLYPQNRVYIDGRFFVHGEAELKKYFSVLASASEFNEQVKKYDINIAVLSTLNPVYASLAAHLGSSGEWVLVHIDDVSSLLLRKNLETEPVIQKLKYKWLKPLTDIRYLSEIPEASRDEAYEEASKVASSHNGRTIGSFMLGYIHLQNALKGKPDTVRTKNELEKAAHFFAKAVSFHDDIGIIQYYFGKTLMLLGEKEKGEKALKKSSELIPQATN
jgi:tetratricopeptide (TPR) repeat protein